MVKLLLHADLLMLKVIEHLIGLVVGMLIIVGFLANALPGVAALVVDSLLGKDLSALFRVGGVAEIHGGTIDLAVIDAL